MNVEYRFMEREEFWPLFKQHEPLAFPENNMIDIGTCFSDTEKEKLNHLHDQLNVGYKLYLTAWVDNVFAGWCWGFQKSGIEYYMCNSAVLPEYRKHRIYSTMLMMTLEKLTSDGFQEITSKHHACNNAVLLPKLKAGFMISGFEINPRFGTLVALSYYPNKQLELLYQQRTGFKK